MTNHREGMKPPTNRVIVEVEYIAYKFDYPKNKERFIWGIPSEYDNIRDREVSALTCCLIYDGTQKSLDAARKFDGLFNGSPFSFIAKKGFNNLIMEQDQRNIVYNTITIKEVYLFFSELWSMYSKGVLLYDYYKVADGDNPHDKMRNVLSKFQRFNGRTILSHAKVDLFLAMMVHFYDDYKIEESTLLPPVFPTYKNTLNRMGLIKGEITYNTSKVISEKLKWFTLKHPITYWVSIPGYMDLTRTEPKLLGKFIKMNIKRYNFKKK